MCGFGGVRDLRPRFRIVTWSVSKPIPIMTCDQDSHMWKSPLRFPLECRAPGSASQFRCSAGCIRATRWLKSGKGFTFCLYMGRFFFKDVVAIGTFFSQYKMTSLFSTFGWSPCRITHCFLSSLWSWLTKTYLGLCWVPKEGGNQIRSAETNRWSYPVLAKI